MNDCIFCKIITKEAPSMVVFEDDHVIAIKPLKEITRGHTLIIPKNHSINILDIDSRDAQKVMEAARELSKKLLEEYQATGINLVHSAGKDAEQTVLHFHMHLVPRYPDGKMSLFNH